VKINTLPSGIPLGSIFRDPECLCRVLWYSHPPK